jgi:HSP20 family molecular chaperone IbpA
MTVLTRWQPFREVTSLQERVNQLFNDVFSDIDSPDRPSLTSFSFAPRTDVYEEDDRIVLEMEVPGMREEDVHLTLEGNTLSISGERKIERTVNRTATRGSSVITEASPAPSPCRPLSTPTAWTQNTNMEFSM